MIKRFGIHLTRYTSENNTFDHIVENLLCKKNANVYQLLGARR